MDKTTNGALVMVAHLIDGDIVCQECADKVDQIKKPKHYEGLFAERSDVVANRAGAIPLCARCGRRTYQGAI
jgi:hypothetical protein